jgi:hypothetical protein
LQAKPLRARHQGRFFWLVDRASDGEEKGVRELARVSGGESGGGHGIACAQGPGSRPHGWRGSEVKRALPVLHGSAWAPPGQLDADRFETGWFEFPPFLGVEVPAIRMRPMWGIGYTGYRWKHLRPGKYYKFLKRQQTPVRAAPALRRIETFCKSLICINKFSRKSMQGVARAELPVLSLGSRK